MEVTVTCFTHLHTLHSYTGREDCLVIFTQVNGLQALCDRL
jgi:hypothetical protein